MAGLIDKVIFWGGFAWGVRKGYRGFRPILHKSLSTPSAQKLLTALPSGKQTAQRYLAGETLDEALAVTRILNENGVPASINLLRENIEQAFFATQIETQLNDILTQIARQNLKANLSIKPSQLGLRHDPKIALRHLETILKHAQKENNWVCLDMEDSSLTTATLDLYYQLRAQGFDNLAITIQATLYRSAGDLQRLIEADAHIRLTRGDYAEGNEYAFQNEIDIDKNFSHLMRLLLNPETLANDRPPIITTHATHLIQATISQMREHNLPRKSVTFQCLYGVRPDLETHLIHEDYNVTVYVPFGTEWQPYVSRRLATDPVNVYALLSNL